MGSRIAPVLRRSSAWTSPIRRLTLFAQWLVGLGVLCALSGCDDGTCDPKVWSARCTAKGELEECLKRKSGRFRPRALPCKQHRVCQQAGSVAACVAEPATPCKEPGKRSCKGSRQWVCQPLAAQKEAPLYEHVGKGCAIGNTCVEHRACEGKTPCKDPIGCAGPKKERCTGKRRYRCSGVQPQRCQELTGRPQDPNSERLIPSNIRYWMHWTAPCQSDEVCAAGEAGVACVARPLERCTKDEAGKRRCAAAKAQRCGETFAESKATKRGYHWLRDRDADADCAQKSAP